jgi:hypothetical protein
MSRRFFTVRGDHGSGAAITQGLGSNLATAETKVAQSTVSYQQDEPNVFTKKGTES